MTSILRPDICVIGAGAGGLSVATAAVALGASVVIVERDSVGGSAHSKGCISAKALLAAGNRAQAMRQAADFGIDDVDPVVDFREVKRHVQGVLDALAPNSSLARLSALGIAVIQASARFKDRRTLIAGDTEIKAGRFVIATGSLPAIPKIEGLGDTDYRTCQTIFDLTRRPTHLVIVGAEPLGLEFAQAFRRLGSRVTIVHDGPILPGEDPEMVGIIVGVLRQDGIEFRQDAKIARVERRGKTGMRMLIEAGGAHEAIDGSHLLVAIGRTADVSALDLGRARIAHDAAGIKVSDTLRTTNRMVYAVGDVVSGAQAVHDAARHAEIVVRAILFRLNARGDSSPKPRALFTDPEFAQIGMTEAQARKASLRFRILRWPYAENDRAQAERRTSGHVKLLVDRREQVLGASIVGHGAAEMASLWALVIAKGLKLGEIAGLAMPYPTMSEIGKRSAIAYLAEKARRPLVRGLVRVLRALG